MRRATLLASRAAAQLELSPVPTRDGVRSARQHYLEAIDALEPDVPFDLLRKVPLRQLAARVERRLRAARRARFFERVRALRRLWPLALLVMAGVVALVATRLADRDLLAGRPFRASSVWAACERGQCGGVPTNVFFHTNEDPEPFIVYDLGRTVALRRVEVTNRLDGNLQSRAVPLVVQVSIDGEAWHDVARRDYWFEVWRAELPSVPTRYLKLKVARRSMFHLERVRAWE